MMYEWRTDSRGVAWISGRRCEVCLFFGDARARWPWVVVLVLGSQSRNFYFRWRWCARRFGWRLFRMVERG